MNRVLALSLVSFLAFGSIEAKTYLVTSLDDSGPGTLREAISYCVAGDSIEFTSGLSGTISLASALPLITVDSLTISGPADLSVVIDGNSLYRLFDVQTGTFALTNLDLRHGAHVNQGGILNIGAIASVNVQNVTVTSAAGNTGENPLFVDLNADAFLTDVLFTHQSASQIYLNRGNVNITAHTPASYLIQGTAESSISKYGEALVNLNAPSEALQGYALGVFEGGMSFTGETSSPCTVYPGGELSGNATACGVSNLGSLQPGTASQVGALQVIGDFYAVNATTQIKLDPMGGTDQILVEGNIFLEGGVFELQPLPGTYLQGTKYTSFLTSEGGINGVFGAISSGGLDVQVAYFPNFIEVEILSSTTIE